MVAERAGSPLPQNPAAASTVTTTTTFRMATPKPSPIRSKGAAVDHPVAIPFGGRRSCYPSDGVDHLVVGQVGLRGRRQRSVALELLDSRHRVGVGEYALVVVRHGA